LSIKNFRAKIIVPERKKIGGERGNVREICLQSSLTVSSSCGDRGGGAGRGGEVPGANGFGVLLSGNRGGRVQGKGKRQGVTLFTQGLHGIGKKKEKKGKKTPLRTTVLRGGRGGIASRGGGVDERATSRKRDAKWGKRPWNTGGTWASVAVLNPSLAPCGHRTR